MSEGNRAPARRVELEEHIDARLLASLSQNFRSANEAISELIDNALASSFPDHPVTVSLTGSFTRGGTLRIVSKGGTGMGTAELRKFLHWGREPDSVGLNRYGQGGKAAVGYLGHGLRLRANRFDEAVAYQFEDAAWLERPDGKTKKFPLTMVEPIAPGVGVVQIEILKTKRTINAKRLAMELSSRYRPALLSQSLKLIIRGKTLGPEEFGIEQERQFSHPLVYREGASRKEVNISGWVGVASPGFEGKGGIRCSAFGRVIANNEYFGHHTSSYKASLNSLVGEVDLSFVPVVLNKTGFDTGSEAWEAARAVMYREMEPLVASLLKRKENREPTDDERLRAMEAKDLAHRALQELLEQEQQGHARHGEANQGRKPPSPSPTPRTLPNRQLDLDIERSPATPPPSNAVGRLRRKGQASDWDVRALDPSIRSARSSELGRPEVVINCNFPLYRERRGDVLYMLETGLLEELKPPPGEEKTVDEYHAELNAAIRLVLTYKGRTNT